MFNFDIERYLGIQNGAVEAAKKVSAKVHELVSDGADSLFFMGGGGAGLMMQPATDLVSRNSSLACYNVICAEIVLTGHRALGPKSVVVLPSLSGTTKESIAALEYAQSKGATVITLIGHEDTPLAKQADHCFVNFAADDTSCEMFYTQSLAAALGAMNAVGERDDYDALMAEMDKLPQHFLKAKEAFEPEAKKIAETIKDETWHIITAAGATWTEANYYGMCILEEMQWIRTRPVHASDFFHGTLEVVEKGVSVIVMKGEDASRPLTDRVVNFARDHTDKLTVIDTKGMGSDDLSPVMRALIGPATLSAMLERLSSHLEHLRDHPLSTRRYYRRVAY